MSQSTPPTTQWPTQDARSAADGVSHVDLLDAIENLTVLVELIAEKLGLDLEELSST